MVLLSLRATKCPVLLFFMYELWTVFNFDFLVNKGLLNSLFSCNWPVNGILFDLILQVFFGDKIFKES